MKNILSKISKRKGQIAILIDPEKTNSELELKELIKKAEFAKADYFFIGGSTVSTKDFGKTMDLIKKNCSIPVVIFPGASNQIDENADALLFLSLISGRNPDFLIGHQIRAAREVFDSNLEIIPTGYVLIDGGNQSSVAYVSQTTPIPTANHSIILDTCKAGVLMGKQLLFLDAGSGAKKSIPSEIIKKISSLGKPVIVGGGIKTISEIKECEKAGANVIVIGNKIEENIDFLLDIKNYLSETYG